MHKNKLSFLVSGGSVPGSDHTAPLRRSNCQDAFGVLQSDDIVVAVVADGNGSEPNSEVGAKLGASLMLNMLSTHLTRCVGRFLEGMNASDAACLFRQAIRRAEQDMLSQIRVLANALVPSGGSFSETVKQNFLFTLLGAIVTKDWSGVFYVGDGVYALNGEVTRLGPFTENKPPYPAYQLFSTEDYDSDSPLVRANLGIVVPTEDVDSILIGTDGVEHLIAAEESKLSGRSDAVGPLSQFWENSQFVENSDAIRRRLALITKESNSATLGKGGVALLNTEPGLLKDDTTIVVFQRH